MSTQQERDHNNLVRDTRAHIGSIIDELQRRYSRVDGTELARFEELWEKNGADIVDEVCAICAMPDDSEKFTHPKQPNTIRRYFK